ncbi:hypothetical protein ACF1BS_03690 [Streptomyces sp. NPDC014748]|uniref:hypothetical protein n=1 Tax=Streptomyces sp. NPDC014748 TaxID=3364905 RepID=UPI0036FF7531
MTSSPASAGCDLAERVNRHMQEHFPYTTAAASWTVARDQRDNTAVVIAGPGDDPNLPGGSYSIHAYHWHCSLQDAGFTVEPRTDMEVFGRPDEQSPDGRARWMHITGWAAPTGRPRKVERRLPAQHFVDVTPGSVPQLHNVGSDCLDTVHGFRFSHYKGRLSVAVVFAASCWTLVGEPPDWVVEIARQHADCPAAKWCRPGGKDTP